ncbi:MAG: type II toxin-antitoxin system prevent-host-death family antitoxin [Gammaproteobacteria bacterium]|nr:type II toxin-antitoxin system prevent-host-death family antitoxin [Gammaproteobacteria bacterium]MCY4182237.1 type II toxin-antitoxin system prevent-host-death family antitoxin [Gammaproteobacteria bacterium]MCY4295433.1 type II toxin-antitoxin system prevent-host-death family antitoxin [Gammaproteobacteria bacterium]
MYEIDAEEARQKLPELLDRARTKRLVTIVRKRGVPCAAIVPLSYLREDNVKSISSLRGSGKGVYGDAAEFVEGERDW